MPAPDAPLPPDPGAATDAPSFAPVAVAARSDGWTPARQQRFIEDLARRGGVAAAARAAGMTARSANKLRARPGAESFAAAWDAAVEAGRLRAYDEALQRGLHGWRAPVVRGGRVVGTRHRQDNRLLFAACYGEPLGRYARR